MRVGSKPFPPQDVDGSSFTGSPSQICVLSLPENFYGTPKPPAEPSAPLNVREQLLPGATPTAEGKRKRNKSVSNMEKASIEPPEEEEEERAVVNGNGVTLTPGQSSFRGPAAEAVGSLANAVTWTSVSRTAAAAAAA